ncbi:MAG: SAM-dependent methyltransferase [Anaerolineales bacterium]|nr:SAM-dependent methyltransferase [Anaerolineales bacterium]
MTQTGMDEQVADKIRGRVLNRDTFARAVFTGNQKGTELAWLKVQVRPVEIKGAYHLQFSFFDEKKDISKNFAPGEATQKLNEVLSMPFRNIFVEGTDGSLQVNISKKGKAVVNESNAPSAPIEIDLLHNREKSRILTLENAGPFLEAAGILTRDGRIRADMQRKYVQINEFLRLVEETNAFEGFESKPLHVVDFGCGSAHLTFALYYYLRHVLNFDAYVTGVDLKADLMARHRERAKSLGWDHLTFSTGEIAGYQTDTAPDMVVALHACDTATDDAIAMGIRWESRVIICAPCCQHDLQVQMANLPPPAPMTPVLGHGILFERMGDILTDTLRAAILRVMGYRTDITQFVPVEHTAKNLMIRAVRTSMPGNNPRWMEEYQNLKGFWQVVPYLEKLLNKSGAEFR